MKIKTQTHTRTHTGAVDESWDTDRPLEASDEGVLQMGLDVGDAGEKVRVRVYVQGFERHDARSVRFFEA